MKNNKIQIAVVLASLACALFTVPAKAQSASSPTDILTTLLNKQLVPLDTPITIQGQTFVVTTNQSGGYTFVSYGPAGNVTNTPPTTIGGAGQAMQQMLADNNPALTNYYSTNEIVASLGAVYVQNSGQAAVKLAVEKYGLIKSLPSWSAGAAVLQGNNSGKSSTAGGYGFVNYRRIIGNTAAEIGAGGGYDNWNSEPMGIGQFEVEQRISKTLGTYAGVGYALEPRSHSGQGGGLIAGGGVRYSFASLNPF